MVVALGPITELKNAEAPILKLLGWQEWIADTLHQSNYLELFGQQRENEASKAGDKSDISFICQYFPEICKGDFSALVDPDPELINVEQLESFMARAGKEGTSLKNLEHLGQLLMTGRFQRFDYKDAKRNELAYGGQRVPPNVDLEKIKIPVALLVGQQDSLATLADNLELRKKLMQKSLVFFKTYAADHISLILGADPTGLNSDFLDLLEYGFQSEI